MRAFVRGRARLVEAVDELVSDILRLRAPEALAEAVVDGLMGCTSARSAALYLDSGSAESPLHRASARGTDFPEQLPSAVEAQPPPGGLVIPIEEQGTHGVLALGPPRQGRKHPGNLRRSLDRLASAIGIAADNARRYDTLVKTNRGLERQSTALQHQLERAQDENRHLRQRADARVGRHWWTTGDSEATRRARREMEHAAHAGEHVLLCAEPGTAVEGAARLIHGGSEQARSPFVTLERHGSANSMLEGELFGTSPIGGERGRRGLMEIVQSGTLFVERVDRLPEQVQTKLARALERDVTRARLIATLPREAAAQRPSELAEDLWARLGTRVVQLPPLRARASDLGRIVETRLAELCARWSVGPKPLSAEAWERIVHYGWPGNERELDDALEGAILRAEGEAIGPEHLALPVAEAGALPREANTDHDVRAHRSVMQTIERERIAEALREASGNRSEAARVLGMPRTTLIHKLRQYGLG